MMSVFISTLQTQISLASVSRLETATKAASHYYLSKCYFWI